MRKRGAQEATPQMGRMGAADPSSLPGGPYLLGVVGERAVRGRAVDDLALHGFRKRDLAASFDERQDAAAETGAHDASAQATLDPPRLLHQRVDVRCRHLEVVPQALMRLLEQNAQSFEFALLERFDERVDASDLRVDMPPPFRIASLRFTTALVVRRVGERAVLARVDDGDHELVAFDAV